MLIAAFQFSPKNADELVNAIVELYSMSLEERGN